MPTLSQSNMTAWGYQHTSKLSVHTKHTTHYTAAMAFIQAHGHFAAITKDGLLALSECAYTVLKHTDAAEHEDDMWFQEPKLFEVDEDGMVVSRDVRVWLGY